jgi:hypothetical protein
MSTRQIPPATAGRAAAGPRLAVNYLPMRFTADSFTAGMIRYESADQLARLRTELSGTHVAVRSGDQIACVPLGADAPAMGEQVTLDTGENLPIVIRLVEESVIRMLLKHEYRLRRLTPPAFVARGPGRDLLEQAAQGHGHELAGVHVYPQYYLDARMKGPTRSPGIVVGVRTRYEIDIPVSELLSRGVTVEGRYVVVDDGGHDPRLDPVAARRAAGAVDWIDGDQLVLRDAPGIQKVAAADAWLQARRETMHDVVHALAGPAAPTIINRLDQAVFGLTGAEGRLAKTAKLATWFGRNRLELAAGLAAEVGAPAGLDGTSTRVNSRRIGEPVFVFDPAMDKTRRYADQGLDEFGPFDAEGFTPKRPSIVVVTPASFKGTVETFISSFLRGVPGAGVFANGFVRKYHLAGCDVRFEAFNSGPGDARAYRDACLAALDRPGKPHLAIVITSQEQEHLGGDDSPYLVAKSAFMGQGVPVQDVQIETIRKGNLAYPLNSIALACYAKLGGTPYVIAAPHSLTQELVIGIGSAHVKQTRLTPPERVVGITTVFSADGNYLLSNKTREADYADYPRELLQSLQECIEDVKARNGWQPGDALRLVFHVFKPLKDTEAQAVKLLVQSLAGEYASVEFAFLHVSEEHNWIIFDQASDGLRTSGRVRGRLVPGRGHAVPVSRSEMLLSVTGPRDMKLELQGLPRPLLLKLHRESTFTDLEYLTGQLFRFTYLSWRRPYPSSHPVTILYSDLIAGLLGQLRHVKNWNADIISTQLRDSRWFL